MFISIITILSFVTHFASDTVGNGFLLAFLVGVAAAAATAVVVLGAAAGLCLVNLPRVPNHLSKALGYCCHYSMHFKSKHSNPTQH
jgi:uncharacterized membrane protein